MKYSFSCYGHENITSRHKTTLEFTKDKNLGLEGDCIIGIKADFDLLQLKKFIKSLKNNRKITIIIQTISDSNKKSINNKNINENDKLKFICNAEMAYSLAAEPHYHLYNTYRNRNFPRGLDCQSISSFPCSNPNCPIKNIMYFLKNKHCPISNCNITPQDIFFRSEQKIVDTLLSSDLIYFTLRNIKDLIIVSSDDDMIPPIRLAILYGANIHHIHQ